MIRPCSISFGISCPGSDSPVLNLSAEASDPLLFAGVGWDPYNPFRPPPLGPDKYISHGCFGITYSAISQELADLMAKNNAYLCNPAPPPVAEPPLVPWPPLPPWPTFDWQPPPFVPPTLSCQQFTNERQTATLTCPDGSVFTYAVEPGTLLSPCIASSLGSVMVDLLNAQALAFAQQQVWAMRVCLNVPLKQFRTPNPPPDWPPGVPWPPNVSWPPDASPPTNWPTGKPWPPPSNPTLAANPGWCCLGQDLDTALNTYSLGSGSKAFTFSITGGALAPGTSLVQVSPRVAQIAGMPSAPGVYTYTVTATETGNPTISTSTTDTLKVFGMTTDSLPDGIVGTPYSDQLVTAGGTDPITFALVGSLPDGLTLSSTGLISGTPTIDGTSSFTVQFTDSEGGMCEQGLSIVVTGVACSFDWSQLVWEAPNYDGSDDSPSLIPLAGSLTANLDASGITNAFMATSINAQVTYLCDTPTNCNFHLDATATVLTYGSSAGSIDIIHDSGNLLTIATGDYWGTSVDIPFTIPGPGTITISVHQNLRNTDPAGTQHVLWQMVLTILPEL